MNVRIQISEIPWKRLRASAAQPGGFDFHKRGYSTTKLFSRIISGHGCFIYTTVLSRPYLPVAATAVFIAKDTLVVPFFYVLPDFRIKHKIFLLLMGKIASFVVSLPERCPEKVITRVCIACPQGNEFEQYHNVFSKYSPPCRDKRNRPLFWYVLTLDQFQKLTKSVPEHL